MTLPVFGFRAAQRIDMETASIDSQPDEQQTDESMEADRSMSRSDR